MEAVRELMYEAIDKYGLGSAEALEASEELDKHIEVAQRQRALTKEEFMTRYLNDMAKRKELQRQMKQTSIYGIKVEWLEEKQLNTSNVNLIGRQNKNGCLTTAIV